MFGLLIWLVWVWLTRSGFELDALVQSIESSVRRLRVDFQSGVRQKRSFFTDTDPAFHSNTAIRPAPCRRKSLRLRRPWRSRRRDGFLQLLPFVPLKRCIVQACGYCCNDISRNEMTAMRTATLLHEKKNGARNPSPRSGRSACAAAYAASCYTLRISNPLRFSRAKNDAACSSPTIFSALGSHLITRFSRAAIAARWQVFSAMTWL